jgi:3',5'-cyclic AMP phosphodiesterase CpdA
VRSWFATDNYFNRDKFSVAFAHIDPDSVTYRLFLCSADSDVIDSWVEYDIEDKVWFGPHKTDLFTPTSAFSRSTASDRKIPLIGGPASVFQKQDTRTDGFNTAIEMNVVGKEHDMGVPDQEKYHGELSMLVTPQTTGILRIETKVGERPQPGATDTRNVMVQHSNLSKPRKRLGRLGKGKHLNMRLVNNNVGEDVKVLGYEVDPVHVLGRR